MWTPALRREIGQAVHAQHLAGASAHGGSCPPGWDELTRDAQACYEDQGVAAVEAWQKASPRKSAQISLSEVPGDRAIALVQAFLTLRTSLDERRDLPSMLALTSLRQADLTRPHGAFGAFAAALTEAAWEKPLTPVLQEAMLALVARFPS